MSATISDSWLVILGLTVATYAIRLSGVLLGQRVPSEGPWARALTALPGCLIVSLVSLTICSGGMREWTAGALALVAAVVTKSLPLTMAVGIAAMWALRSFS
jgi:uncharacterized membrane protein